MDQKKMAYWIKRRLKRSWTLWVLGKLAPWVIGAALLTIAYPSLAVGYSMEPTIMNLDMLIVYRLGEPDLGDIVIATAPEGLGLVAKRIADIQGDSIYLLGDNRNNSYDSRDFGPVSRDDIKGVVTFIIPTGGLISCVKSFILHLYWP